MFAYILKFVCFSSFIFELSRFNKVFVIVFRKRNFRTCYFTFCYYLFLRNQLRLRNLFTIIFFWFFFLDFFAIMLYFFWFLSNSRILFVAFLKYFKDFYIFSYKVESSYCIKYSSVFFLIRLSSIFFIFYFSFFSIKIDFDFKSLSREYQDFSSKI